jgi:hypothetical protein
VGFHHVLQNPHLSRPSPCITLLTFISLRRSVRQPGSSFAKFIKLTDHVSFCCQSRFYNSLIFLKENDSKFSRGSVAFTFYKRTSSFLIPFLIISSDAFGVTSIYLLLNTLIKNLKFPLSIPVANISGICAGFSLSRDLLHLGTSIV